MSDLILLVDLHYTGLSTHLWPYSTRWSILDWLLISDFIGATFEYSSPTLFYWFISTGLSTHVQPYFTGWPTLYWIEYSSLTLFYKVTHTGLSTHLWPYSTRWPILDWVLISDFISQGDPYTGLSTHIRHFSTGVTQAWANFSAYR